ncbi:MAG TPA: hypothetical protein DCG16_10820 [Gemmatimonadetes bacterium]|nr:hypothetical protein [Gemmatimonadota bacterium]|tara:strand:- start:4291 stop:4497 length:207 start_codon:yes stop_codon:yes gene_type:complete
MSAADRLDAYQQILARRPDDGYRRGSRVTQVGAPDRHERWRFLAVSSLVYILIDRDDGRRSPVLFSGG